MSAGAFSLGSMIVRLSADTTGLLTATSAMNNFSSRVSTQSSQISQRLNKLSNEFKRFGGDATRALTIPLSITGISGIKQFMNYETTLAHIEGLTGATSEQTKKWSGELRNMSAAVGKKPQELAEALYYIASSGVDASKAMDILNVSAKASLAGLGTTQQMADVLTSAMNAYAKSGLTATRAAEILTVAVREGKIEASQFATHLGYAIPIASLMGVKFEQVTAAMASMSLTGSDASTAATQLRQVLSDVLKPAVTAEGALKQFGLSGAKLRQIIEDDGLLAAMQAMGKVIEKEGVAAVANFIPDVRSLTGALQMMGENADHVAEIFKEVATDQVAFGKAVEVVQGTLEFKYNVALAQVNNSLIDFGAAMKSSLIPILESFANALNSVTRWFNSLSETQQKWILYTGAALALIGPLVYGIGSLIGVVNGLIKAFAILGMAMKTHPLMAIATVITGVMLAMRGMRSETDLAADAQERLNDEFDRTQQMRLAYEGIAEQVAVLGNLNKAQVQGLGSAIQTQLTQLEGFHAEALAKAKSNFEYWQKIGGQKGPETVSVVQRNLGGYGWKTGVKKEAVGTDWSKVFEESSMAVKAIEDKMANLKIFAETVGRRINTMGGKKIPDNKDMIDVANEIAKIFEQHGQSMSGLNKQAELFGPSMEMAKKYVQQFNGTLEKALEYLPLTDTRVADLSIALMEAAQGAASFEENAKFVDGLTDAMEAYVESAAQAAIQVPDTFDIEPIAQDYISNMEAMIWYNENFNGSLMSNKDLVTQAKAYLAEYQQQFEDLWNRGVRPGEEAMDKLIEKMDRLNGIIKDSGPAWASEFASYAGVVSDLLGTFEGFVNASQKRALKAVETTAKQQNRSDVWLANEREKIEKEYAKKAKAIAIIQAIINTAVAVTKSLPNIPLAIATGIAGAAQVALIAAQPLAEGGIVPDGYPNDTYPARLSSKEIVVPPGKLDKLMGKNTARITIDDIIIDGTKLRIVLKEVERVEQSAYY